MRLRTRVLSFMLAGSMMLSATPVSAFAGTPVLGGGTVSPTALSETNSTDGVYDSRVDGSHELRCMGGIFTDTQNTTYKNAIYVVNQNSAPAAKLKFTPPDGHSIVAWRIDMGTAWGYNDATNSKVQMLLKAANLKCSADNTELTFTCPGSITYGGETYPAFVADASLTPVLNITAADLLFEKGTIVLGNELSSGSGITATLVYYSVTDGVKGSEAMTTRPTKPGQYQIAVRLSVDGASATDKYANRVKCGNVYYQVDPSQELTSEKWRYRVVSSSVNLTVDANGEPVVPSGTAGVSYADGVLTIYPRFVVHFGVNDIVKCNIVNEGKLDGGIFTGTVTNKGVIESGMFVNKPENANSVKFAFTSGTTFCGLKDPSGTTSLYIVCTGKGSYPQPAASYSNPSRTAWGWLVAATSPSFKGTTYGSMMTNNWTLVSSISTALSEQLYDAVAVYTPVAYMDSSDLSIDPTGKVNISIPEVKATGVTYTNTATKETFTSYPTVAGNYVAKVSLECTRDWDSLASKDPVIPASALLADDGVAALSEEQENPLRRIALKGDLYYYVPETLDVEVTVEQSAPASSVVTLTVDANGAPVIPEGAKGVHYENNTLTIDANTTAQFAQDSTVKCDIVNNGTLDGGLFTGAVTGSGSIARGLFLHDPKTSLPTMMLSVPENASLNGITAPDATGLTTLYAINALDGKDNMLLFIGDYIGTDPHTFYGWDLVYSFGGEEKNSDVEKNYIGKTHFEQPMYGPIPDGMNGVRCIFLPVLEMNASDLTITADKTESKITGAVIDSVQYVDESDPNAAPSTVYPTKAGKYKAIVTLTCPGDSTYSKARVARIGNLCYHVPETLEVSFTVDSEPVPVVPPTDGEGNVTIPEGTDEVKGDGWTAKKDDEGKTTVTITDSTNLNNTTLNCNKITIGSEGTSTTVSNITTNAEVTVISGSTIDGGTFSGNVTSAGEIKGGTFEEAVTIVGDGTITDGAFKGNVSGTGTITGGTFSGSVSGGTIEGGTFRGDIGSEVTINGGTFTGNVDSANINGGVFANEPTNIAASKAKVTVTGGATVNNLKNDGNDESRSSTVTVVTGKEQTIQLSAEIEGRDLIGWKETAGDNDPTLNTDSSITINQNDATERTFTPVVMMNEKDLTAAGESKITGVTVTSLLYYPVNDAGEITGEGSAERPTEDGSYILVAMLELSSQEPSENGIALFAAENTDLSRVVEQDGIGYYVPESLTVERITNGEDVPSDTGSGDSGAGGAAVAVIGGAAIGGAAYLIGTQVYLTSVLPEGASIPTNRQQLADLLWTAAGKPQPASTALFTDISADAADSQKAARWCVEQGLLKDTGSTFKPDKHTFRPQVIKAWNDLQAKLNPQK